MNTNIPSKSASSTMGAWFLMAVAFGLYTVFSTVFSKGSLLGAAAAGQLLCLLLPAVLYAKWKTGSAVEGLRLRQVSGGILCRVALLAVTFIGFGDLLQKATQPLIEPYFSHLIPLFEELTKLLKPNSASGLVGNLLVVAFLVPVCEEAIFRGAFQGTLEKRGPLRAILASSLVFALVHLNPFGFLTIFFIGIALGFLTWRTQSLVPAILWHVINNAAAILALYFGGESASMPIWLSVVLTVGFFGLVWEFLRYMKHAPPATTGPLAAAVPSLSGSRVWLVAKVGGITALLALFASIVCFGLAHLASDFLAPDFSRGDIVFYTRGPAFRSDRVTTGDVILYRRNGRMFFTRILAMDGEKLTVIGPEDAAGKRGNMDLLRKDITGKVFWKFDPGAEVKGLMPKPKANPNDARKVPLKDSQRIQNESSQ